jgi:alpha-aminoadipate carrier protein LysW
MLDEISAAPPRKSPGGRFFVGPEPFEPKLFEPKHCWTETDRTQVEGDNQMPQVECVECGAELNLPADVMQGEIIPCAECGAELEVITLEPLVLDLAPVEMEDWGE